MENESAGRQPGNAFMLKGMEHCQDCGVFKKCCKKYKKGKRCKSCPDKKK